MKKDSNILRKLRCYAIKVKKKISKQVKWVFVYDEVVARILSSTVPHAQKGIQPSSPQIMRSIFSNADLREITLNNINIPNKTVFNEKQMVQLYDLAIQCRNNSISQERVIMELRVELLLLSLL